jgi:phosphatidylserine/phosphatidylglycerophosphate/cardiolipin synthase-like enzyme
LIELRTLTDGGQTPDSIAAELASFLDGAERSLDIAIYDVKLSGPAELTVLGALVAARERGVTVRLAFNADHPGHMHGPPPPATDPELLAALPVETRPIPGIPDLMHHKYIVRDGSVVWTGSTNWTLDSWTREENVIVRVASEALAASYTADFEQLWEKGSVEASGAVAPAEVRIGSTPVRAWFCPRRGLRLVHRIANAVGRAERRIRIASPVITSGPILGSLCEAAADGRVDIAGVVDITQIEEVFSQWGEHAETTAWKAEALKAVLRTAPFSGKRSTPYTPTSIHDYMHAKLTVCDDTVFVGSFNLSHSGERNAENVLELEDAALADRLAAFVDEVRARYPPVSL